MLCALLDNRCRVAVNRWFRAPDLGDCLLPDAHTAPIEEHNLGRFPVALAALLVDEQQRLLVALALHDGHLDVLLVAHVAGLVLARLVEAQVGRSESSLTLLSHSRLVVVVLVGGAATTTNASHNLATPDAASANQTAVLGSDGSEILHALRGVVGKLEAAPNWRLFASLPG